MPTYLQRYQDNRLIGSTLSSTPAPAASYDLDYLLSHRPAQRILWGASTVDIQITLPAPARVDLLVIPVWNVDAGSGVASLTNGAGLNEAITVPAMRPSGIPIPTVLDVTVAEPNPTTRTSNVFHVIVTGNSVNLLMGGVLLLYGPARPFIDRDFHWGYSSDPRGYFDQQKNDHGIDLTNPRGTMDRPYQFSTLASRNDAAVLEDWNDASYSGALPCFAWVDPDGRNVALFGRITAFQRGEVYVPPNADLTEGAIAFTVGFLDIARGKSVV